MQVPTLVYRPEQQGFRVVWYGGESTILHFDKLWNTFDPDTGAVWQEWLNRAYQTLPSIPTSMKDMLMEMEEYYQLCMELEEELLREQAE